MDLRKYLHISLAILAFGCSSENKTHETPKKEEAAIAIPALSADSAYHFVQRQVEFGPRVPGTDSHEQAGDWLVEKLEQYGATVTEQKFDAVMYDGTEVPLRNIIGAFYPERSRRILLAAHWDSRPFADKDDTDTESPIDGANDGASGVGVLLEIARVIDDHAPPNVGIDIIFFDGEDWGERIDEARVPTPDSLDSWYCIGSQYWARNKHQPNYAAYYGILLDMVGARGSQFHKEGLSTRMAPKIVDKVWDRANKLGYGGIFVNSRKAEITDDHTFVNLVGKIPMINIVHYDPEEGYFGDYHHTHKDNMEIIDRNMLKIVGSTVLGVLFYE